MAAFAAQRHACPRRGTAAVELALVLPLLVALALACVDLGRAMHCDIILSNAARDGVQYGAVHRITPYTMPAWEAEIRLRIAEELAHLPGFEASRLSISLDVLEQPDDLPRIEVDLRYQFKTIVDWPGLPQTVPIRRRVSMKQYR